MAGGATGVFVSAGVLEGAGVLVDGVSRVGVESTIPCEDNVAHDNINSDNPAKK